MLHRDPLDRSNYVLHFRSCKHLNSSEIKDIAQEKVCYLSLDTYVPSPALKGPSVVNSDLRIWSSDNLQKTIIKRRIFKQNWTNFHCCPVQKAESRTTKSLLLQDWVFRLGMLHIHIPILRVFTTPFPELKRPYLGSFFRVRQVTLPEYGISAQKYWRRGFHIDVYYCYDFTLNFAQWLLSPYFFSQLEIWFLIPCLQLWT